jgi:sugar/nucleoside kinase (ribokinase family)
LTQTRFFVAGHVEIDEIVDASSQATPRVELGGALCYSSITLASMGYKPTAVTKIGIDFPSKYVEMLKQFAALNLEGSRSEIAKTTRFRIERTPEDRDLWLLAKCEQLTIKDFQTLAGDIHVSGPKAVILNAVAGEIGPKAVQFVLEHSNHVFVDSQSFVRTFDSATGHVGLRKGMDLSFLKGVELIKADERELAALTGITDRQIAIESLSAYARDVLVSSGPGQAEIYQHGSLKHFSQPPKVDVRDTTGAGDILLASYSARLMETNDAEKSLEFATLASSLSTEILGVQKAIVSRDKVLRRIALDKR